MTKIFAEEGSTYFDARSASLGHTMQGGVPSPRDRTTAARLSLRCLQFLETHAHKAPQGGKVPGKRVPSNTIESAASITVQGSAIVFVPVDEMLKAADIKNRRGKIDWWKNYKGLAELMGGRTGIVEHTKKQKD